MNMTANSNKVIYLYADILLVLRGKQLVKVIAVTNVAIVIIQKWEIKKEQYLNLLSTTILGSSVSLFCFSKNLISNAAEGKYIKYPPK